MRIGVISDTHGLVRPEALAALAGSELIVHAGDIGGPEVLEALASDVIDVAGRAIYVIHDVHELDVDPSGFAAVIAGHSHQPRNERVGGVLFFNPGSAGPRRFSLPIALGSRGVRGTILTLV